MPYLSYIMVKHLKYKINIQPKYKQTHREQTFDNEEVVERWDEKSERMKEYRLVVAE